MLGDRDAAQDAVQLVFVTLLEELKQIREPESLSGWLLTVASHRCHKMLTERIRMPLVEDIHSDSPDMAAVTSATEQGMVRTRMVERALLRLSSEFREVIILREYQDLSYRSIAEVIGASESTVRFRLHAARKKLCELLKPVMAKEDRYEMR
jgi:RNA polymerase sigma-70 factor (ECF subfamily)